MQIVRPFQRVAIVNRGEAAARFLRGARLWSMRRRAPLAAGILVTEADRGNSFTAAADFTIPLGAALQPGPGGVLRSAYLDIPRIIGLVREHGCDAVWPGWGFLSESPEFAEACAAADLVLLGPSAAAMRMLGDKIAGKRLAESCGVPVAPWSGGPVESAADARAHGERIGFPLLLKAAAGGGGRGIRVVSDPRDLEAAFTAAAAEAAAAFGDATLLVEAFVPIARHVEVQLIADAHGTVLALGTRDCSMQRRHQKVIEEAPARLPPALEQRLLDSAAALCRRCGYVGAGTAEFLVRADGGDACFLEMNTRLQVEHTVTECVTDFDLVGAQIDVARGERLPETPPPSRGHAIEVRLCAEDPGAGFQPSTGRILSFSMPQAPGLRVDTGFAQGDTIPGTFDSMLAKIIATGPTREEAMARLQDALSQTSVAIEGGPSNRGLLLELCAHPDFRAGRITTRWLDAHLGARSAASADPRFGAAFVAAATAEYRRDQQEAVAVFLGEARRGLPQMMAPARPRQYRYLIDGAQLEVEVAAVAPGQFRLRAGDLAVKVVLTALGPGEGELRIGDRSLRVIQVVTGTAVHVEVEGATFRFERASDGTVLAPLPGAVCAVHVRSGDLVHAGDRLLTLEVMKMEVPIRAAIGGRVSRLLVDTASRVTAGDPMAAIEPLSSGASAFGGSPLGALPGAVPAELAEEPMEVLRAALLGYDFSDASFESACARLRTGPLGPREQREIGLTLETYLNGALLFDDAPAEPAGAAPATLLARLLKDAPARLGSYPAAFLSLLRAALPQGAVDDKADGAPTGEALLRLTTAQRCRHVGEASLGALLGALLHVEGEAPPALWEPLEPLAAQLVERSPELAGAALSALHHLRGRHTQRRAVERQAEAAAAALRELSGGQDEPPALACAPLVALLALVERWLGEAPPARLRLLESLMRRLHGEPARLIAIEDAWLVCDAASAEAEEAPAAAALAALCPADGVARLLRALLAAAPAAIDGRPLELDIFLPAPRGPALTSLESSAAAWIDSAAPPSTLRRVTFSWGDPAAGCDGRTFHRGAAGFVESKDARGIHPGRAAALGRRFLGGLSVRRLPSAGEVLLAGVRAKDGSDEERVVAIAEIEGFEVERDPASGLALRVSSVRRVYLEALHALRAARQSGPRTVGNCVLLQILPVVSMPRDELVALTRRMLPHLIGLDVERLSIGLSLSGEGGARTPLTIECRLSQSLGDSVELHERPAAPIAALTPLDRRRIAARRAGHLDPYEIVRLLAPAPGDPPSSLGIEGGDFCELDLDGDGSLAPVERPRGENRANVVVGLLSQVLPPFSDGLTRVLLLGDPGRGMGSLAEPECRRIIAAFDLAEREGLPVEWLPVSSGARISMDSGTENLDWTARVLARIIRFTQAGGVVNLIVDGLCIGAQSYWNAEATMLMHCRGTLIMTARGAMLLTGKKALEFSGSVAGEDSLAIGGYRRIMGPNGEAQYFAPDLLAAYRLLLRHYRLTHLPPGAAAPRRLPSRDPAERDIQASPYSGPPEDGFERVGDLFDESRNPGRRRPFSIGPLMRAVLDEDVAPLERWSGWQGAGSAVVMHGSIAGHPLCCIGIESRALARAGDAPVDGPEQWSAATLFPLSSKKVARAINAASGSLPVVVLANLSGFDGSPESLRSLQLEYGAEIGRAVVNFRGPLVLCVIARYHGGAYVVFSQALSPTLQAVALRGSFASVIGGSAAAAVVFPALVRKRAAADPRLHAARAELERARQSGAGAEAVAVLRAALLEAERAALAAAQAQVAREFDGVHTVERARAVGSLTAILDPAELRPALLARIMGGAAG